MRDLGGLVPLGSLFFGHFFEKGCVEGDFVVYS
jgi:hypothetical protein